MTVNRWKSLYDRLEGNRFLLAMQSDIMMARPLLPVSLPADGCRSVLHSLFGGAVYHVPSVILFAALEQNTAAEWQFPGVPPLFSRPSSYPIW